MLSLLFPFSPTQNFSILGLDFCLQDFYMMNVAGKKRLYRKPKLSKHNRGMGQNAEWDIDRHTRFLQKGNILRQENFLSTF